ARHLSHLSGHLAYLLEVYRTISSLLAWALARSCSAVMQLEYEIGPDLSRLSACRTYC
ncbi:hypothetical protein KI387_010232, partial [Taxus chinensis]